MTKRPQLPPKLRSGRVPTSPPAPSLVEAFRASGHRVTLSGAAQVDLSGVTARGVRPRKRTGERNGLEARWEAMLEADRLAGRVLWFAFEAIRFRLADNTTYTPDFAVMLESGVLQIHEVKGHWEDDARVKIKVAAEMFPLEFLAVSVDAAGQWKTERIPGLAGS